jgi:PhnB protein
MPRHVGAIPKGYHSLTPFLCVRDAASALKFHKKVFGAIELERHDEMGAHAKAPARKISLAHIKIDDSPMMISDETSHHVRAQAQKDRARSPHSLRSSSASVYAYLPDVDSVFERAVASGARVIRPLRDADWGDRMGEIEDPFGHIWCIATHKRDVPIDEH